jgi:hypothetical protein
MTKGTIRRLDARALDGVERADPNGPPTAFRIWKAGDNTTDHGPTFFTERSAALLMAQQQTRQNRFPIDIDHLSLDKSAPLENRRAVGWFDIDVRNGELWAVNVEWTDVVCSGLAKDPPEWRYHSPAYDLDVATDEVVSLTNLALTNVPATHGVTALASREASQPKGSSRMKLEDIKAAFDGADDEKKAKAWAAIAAAMASDGDKPDEPSDEKKDAKASEDEPEKKDAKAAADEPEKKDSEDEPEKKDAKATKSAAASMLAEHDAELRAVKAELATMRAEKEAGERKSLIASREMSPELAKKLATKPLALVREICDGLPKRATRAGVVTPDTVGVTATRGEGQGEGAAGHLPPDERQRLDERMGLRAVQATVRNEGVHQIFPAMTPTEARRIQAAKQSPSNGGKA